MGPKSQVPSHLRLIRVILAVESMKVGTYTSLVSQALSPKYDMNVYTATLFGDEARDLCWELSRAKS